MINLVTTRSNLIMPVPKETIQKLIARLNGYIATANAVTYQSTPIEINRSEVTLHRARELFTALWEMKALANWMDVEEELNRLEEKIESIRRERNKYYRPRWRS